MSGHSESAFTWVFVLYISLPPYIPLVDFNYSCVLVPDPGKGVCADPVNGAAILGKEGPDPQGGNKGRQLSPDKGREKT